MCTANSRRICLLCLLLYCFTCVKSGRNPNVPRGGSRRVSNNDPPTITPLPVVKATEPAPFYMKKDFFIGELMKKYGDGDKIAFEGLEHLLNNLGLGGIEKFDHGIQCHKSADSSKFLDLHLHHNHSKSSVGPQVNTSCDQYDSVHSHHNPSHEHDDHEIHSHDGHSHDGHSHDSHSHDGHDHSHDNEHTNELSDHEHEHTDHKHEHNDDHIDHEHTTHASEVNTHEHINDVSTADTDTTDSTVLNVTTEVNNTVTHADLEHSDHQARRKRRADHNKCLSAETLVQSVQANIEAGLTQAEFKELCPSLIYQLDTDSCHTRNHASGDHDHFHHDHDHDHAHEGEMPTIGFSNVSAKVWGFSTIAVVLISLVGLLGVAVIPIMQKVFYNHLLQFLVALAVGALSGDALLHLFPHAMGGHDHGSHDDDEHAHEPHDPTMIYKGLCGLMGIYFFFWSERLLTIFTESKRRKKEMKNKAKKYIDEEEKIGTKLADQCDGMMMSIHPNKALQNYALEAHKEHCSKQYDDTFVSHRHGPCPNGDAETPLDGEERISMIHDTPKSHHGHGHSHGLDGVPTSVASVAWMVIMGDGIHNFCDGLAIGAAFVNSITGGFSTSIAVLCHELPHEIGDFAMLLRAGMTAKQAIFYNCVSSILCFVGMLVGVAIGNVGGATLWVFALVGGMFLYIALVDMLPELSSVETKKGEHPLCHLLLQCLGMLAGAGVMLIIALYEDDLISILEY